MPGVKRTAVLEGVVLSVGHEKAGSPVVCAALDFTNGNPSIGTSNGGALGADLNASSVNLGGYHDPVVVLRGADVRWLGKRCKLTVTIEVEP